MLTFSEYALRLASELADRIGLPGHDLATLDRLTRKSAQRRRLAEAGVDAVRYESVHTLEEVGRAIDRIGLPVVLKPAVGTHSRDTFRIDDHKDWQAVEEALVMREEFVVEELLVGDPGPAGPRWGDHVSVEHVSFEGESRHVVTLGKFPLAVPFRETGDFFPSTLDHETLASVNGLAAEAISALGVRHGITHTEVKFTPAGPKIIEVNGRLGGGVADIVRKAGGRDPVAMAFEVAVGRRPHPSAPPPDGNVVFEMSILSPQDRVRITRVRGLDALRAMDGVDRMVAVARPGSVVDWRTGSVSQLCTVYGHASDHDALQALRKAIHQTYVCDFAPEPTDA
ncbi:ATP-grasp domain-containing protein [Actinoplanes sp. NPDC048791]|uniref:ATP-grasp domain-containing protein n=1 Tax=Actinoplanes sp. NPDC048791 TaxID=3154623 RepID=UPI0034101078